MNRIGIIATTFICILILGGFSCFVFLNLKTDDYETVKNQNEYSEESVSEVYDEEELLSDVENEKPADAVTDNISDEQAVPGTIEENTDINWDLMTLEEKDKYRDTERKKVTPEYESLIRDEIKEVYDYNSNVIGYIHIDDTNIDGPVLQTLADYEYYLHRDIDGVPSEPGCIILDADSEIGIGTIDKGYLNGYTPTSIQLVHGHNMKNGTMFGSLLKYADQNYGLSHSIIRYDSLYEKRNYKVLGAFYSQIFDEESENFKYYNWNNFTSLAEYNEWYKEIREMSLYWTDEDVKYGDEFIVLSTCSYHVENGRFAVVGVRVYE